MLVLRFTHTILAFAGCHHVSSALKLKRIASGAHLGLPAKTWNPLALLLPFFGVENDVLVDRVAYR